MPQYVDLRSVNDNETFVHSYLFEPLLNLLGDKHAINILDLGCGIGSLTNQLIEKGYNVYGTDASEKGIEIARKHYPDRFALQNIESQELPECFNDIEFNTIIATEVIEHLYNPRKFIQFCKGVLSKHSGGDLIISTPYHGYLKNLIISLSGYWDVHMNPLWDGGHIKMWSRNSLTKLLEEQGFQVTHFHGCGRIPFLWKSMIIKATIK